MPKRSSTDQDECAAQMVALATGEPPEGKNPAAVALGRLDGLKGGRARADKLSARKRKEIAKKAAQARWKSKKK